MKRLCQNSNEMKYLTQFVTSLNLRTPPKIQSSSQFWPTPPQIDKIAQICRCTRFSYLFLVQLWLHFSYSVIYIYIDFVKWWQQSPPSKIIWQQSPTINTNKISANVVFQPIFNWVKLPSVHRSPRTHQVRTWYLAKVLGLVSNEPNEADHLFEPSGDIRTSDTGFRTNPFHLFGWKLIR